MPYFWHMHPNADEMFLGVDGVLVLEQPGQRLEFRPGQAFVVPRGTPHRTSPGGAYSVNLTLEPADMETVEVPPPADSGR